LLYRWFDRHKPADASASIRQFLLRQHQESLLLKFDSIMATAYSEKPVRTDNIESFFEDIRALWAEPFVPLRLPKLFNIRRDPFETADTTSNTYWDWVLYRVPRIVEGVASVAQFLKTFEKYPPRQKPGSFTVLELVEQYKKGFGW